MKSEPPPILNPSLKQISSSFDIKQGEITFILTMKSKDENMTLELSEENMLFENYEKKLNISDINNIHKIFSNFLLFKEFFDYIKAQIENKKVEILRINDEKISIKLKEENIEIILNKKRLNTDAIIRKICQEMKTTKINLEIIELKYEKINLENSRMNQEIKSLKASNIELKKENSKIKDNIKHLYNENKKLKESNKILESKIDIYKSIDDEIQNMIKEEKKKDKPVIKNIIEENKNIQNKFSHSENSKNEDKNNSIKKVNTLNLDNINNNTKNHIENIKPFNMHQKVLNQNYIKKRVKSFSKRSNTLNDIKSQKLDIIKDNEQIEQNRFKKFNKRNEFENIKEEDDDIFSNEDDRDLNSLNIKFNKMPQLFDRRFQNTSSSNDLSLKKIFNKKISRNRILNNSPKNYKLNNSNNTFNYKNIENLNNKYPNNFIINSNDKIKFNMKNNIKNKDNNEDKIRNNSSDNKRSEIYKNNLTEYNYKLQATPINNLNKNISFYFPNNKNFNNQRYQNYDMFTKYKINTEHKKNKSNKIVGNIFMNQKNLFKSNENKQEKKNVINNSKNYKNIINNPNESFRFGQKYKLNNYANVIKNVKGPYIINSTLQCLANVKQLVEYFLNKKGEIKTKINQQKLSNVFLETVENLWENKSIKEYASTNFNNIILNQMNYPLFLNSKEIITFILETLHKELNTGKNNNQDFKFNYFGENFDEYFQNFEKFYKENYQSIISELFYQKCDCKINCLNCNTDSHQIHLTYIFTFSLEEVMTEFNNINKKYISIHDCFKYYQKVDYEFNKCVKCKKEDYMGKSNILLVASKVLIININGIKKIENKIEIDDEIDLSEFFYYKEKEYKYELISILTFLENEQIIAFCKSFVDNKWYKYNDSKVTQISFKEAKSKGYPYLLFYSLKEKK